MSNHLKCNVLHYASEILGFSKSKEFQIERNQRRHCKICNSGDIDDEYHFICICSSYNQIRKRYINKFYFYIPSVVKFIELMQSVNYSVVIELCKLIREAFIIRQNIVNYTKVIFKAVSCNHLHVYIFLYYFFTFCNEYNILIFRCKCIIKNA
jgi:hypothetical protein